jgi:PAS domain S-box-containing protein
MTVGVSAESSIHRRVRKAMLEEIIQDPRLSPYTLSFQRGDTLFSEGEESQDLYILVSGELEILKGNKRVATISERGSSFGEMSFLLGDTRTATVKATKKGKAIRIPAEEGERIFKTFPALAVEIPRILAQRLQETTSGFYGFKEFCDKLPDAVIVTDVQGKIVAWNKAAEEVYGRTWDEMNRSLAEGVYLDPANHTAFVEDIKSNQPAADRIVKIMHPQKGVRHIATSNRVLYDGNYNLEGVLSLCRDVTRLEKSQRRYKKAFFWLLPVSVFLGLVAAFAFAGYPRLVENAQIVDIKHQVLRDQIAKDRLLLTNLLVDPFYRKDRKKTSQVMKEFIEIQQRNRPIYWGIVLLGPNKKVLDAYCADMERKGKEIMGNSYGGISFQDIETSSHKVLVLYRADGKSPMGCKCVEVAFEMRKGENRLGWLLFQMDMARLGKAFNADEEVLKKFRF